MTVIDAHHHLWDLDRVDYPWLTPEHGPIFRSFREHELEPELAWAGVDRTVIVQAMDSYADTDYLFEAADRWPRIAGIVGWVPLTRPEEAQAALDQYTKDPRFVGVRHLVHEEPDPRWLRRTEVAAGLDLLARCGLAFDLVAVFPRHLEHVPQLSARHPSLRMVIDHLAKPPVAQGEWEPWASQLRTAAENPNVYAKLSGLDTAADPAGWSADDLRRYTDHALAVFGPERVMFGSDWPVSVLGGGYRKVWRETTRLLAPLTAPERARVLGGTAADCYRLPGLDP